MIINQYENNIQLPNDSLKNDINSNPSSEFISNLMLNPIKYREFKQNINRINNIDNEINLIKTQDTFNKINFSEIIPIDYEEYKSSIFILYNLIKISGHGSNLLICLDK